MAHQKVGPLELQRCKRGRRYEIKWKDLCDLLEMKAIDGPLKSDTAHLVWGADQRVFGLVA